MALTHRRHIDPLELENMHVFVVEREDVDLDNHWKPEDDEQKEWEFFREWGTYWDGSTYNYQCFSGHVGSVERGSDLEQECILREAYGYLDAICVGELECPQCQEDHAWRERQLFLYDYDIDLGSPWS